MEALGWMSASAGVLMLIPELVIDIGSLQVHSSFRALFVGRPLIWEFHLDVWKSFAQASVSLLFLLLEPLRSLVVHLYSACVQAHDPQSSWVWLSLAPVTCEVGHTGWQSSTLLLPSLGKSVASPGVACAQIHSSRSLSVIPGASSYCLWPFR